MQPLKATFTLEGGYKVCSVYHPLPVTGKIKATAKKLLQIDFGCHISCMKLTYVIPLTFYTSQGMIYAHSLDWVRNVSPGLAEEGRVEDRTLLRTVFWLLAFCSNSYWNE